MAIAKLQPFKTKQRAQLAHITVRGLDMAKCQVRRRIKAIKRSKPQPKPRLAAFDRQPKCRSVAKPLQQLQQQQQQQHLTPPNQKRKKVKGGVARHRQPGNRANATHALDRKQRSKKLPKPAARLPKKSTTAKRTLQRQKRLTAGTAGALHAKAQLQMQMQGQVQGRVQGALRRPPPVVISPQRLLPQMGGGVQKEAYGTFSYKGPTSLRPGQKSVELEVPLTTRLPIIDFISTDEFERLLTAKKKLKKQSNPVTRAARNVVQ